MRKYFTDAHVSICIGVHCDEVFESYEVSMVMGRDLRLSTCCRATWASWGRLCCAASDSMNVSGFWGGAIDALLCCEYIVKPKSSDNLGLSLFQAAFDTDVGGSEARYCLVAW